MAMTRLYTGRCKGFLGPRRTSGPLPSDQPPEILGGTAAAGVVLSHRSDGSVWSPWGLAKGRFIQERSSRLSFFQKGVRGAGGGLMCNIASLFC